MDDKELKNNEERKEVSKLGMPVDFKPEKAQTENPNKPAKAQFKDPSEDIDFTQEEPDDFIHIDKRTSRKMPKMLDYDNAIVGHTDNADDTNILYDKDSPKRNPVPINKIGASTPEEVVEMLQRSNKKFAEIPKEDLLEHYRQTSLIYDEAGNADRLRWDDTWTEEKAQNRVVSKRAIEFGKKIEKPADLDPNNENDMQSWAYASGMGGKIRQLPSLIRNSSDTERVINALERFNYTNNPYDKEIVDVVEKEVKDRILSKGDVLDPDIMYLQDKIKDKYQNTSIYEILDDINGRKPDSFVFKVVRTAMRHAAEKFAHDVFYKRRKSGTVSPEHANEVNNKIAKEEYDRLMESTKPDDDTKKNTKALVDALKGATKSK